jgi:hypothetical protein
VNCGVRQLDTSSQRQIVSFRRSPDAVTARAVWRAFLERHASEVAASGLPPAATESAESWDEFLMHGFLSGDPGGFTVDHLSEPRYLALVRLASAYFAEFQGFYTPMALRVADQDALAARFGAQE